MTSVIEQLRSRAKQRDAEFEQSHPKSHTALAKLAAMFSSTKKGPPSIEIHEQDIGEGFTATIEQYWDKALYVTYNEVDFHFPFMNNPLLEAEVDLFLDRIGAEDVDPLEGCTLTFRNGDWFICR